MRNSVWVASVVYLPADKPVWTFLTAFARLKDAREWLKDDRYPRARARIPCKKRIQRFDRAK